MNFTTFLFTTLPISDKITARNSLGKNKKRPSTIILVVNWQTLEFGHFIYPKKTRSTKVLMYLPSADSKISGTDKNTGKTHLLISERLAGSPLDSDCNNKLFINLIVMNAKQCSASEFHHFPEPAKNFYRFGMIEDRPLVDKVTASISLGNFEIQ